MPIVEILGDCFQKCGACDGVAQSNDMEHCAADGFPVDLLWWHPECTADLEHMRCDMCVRANRFALDSSYDESEESEASDGTWG